MTQLRSGVHPSVISYGQGTDLGNTNTATKAHFYSLRKRDNVVRLTKWCHLHAITFILSFFSFALLPIPDSSSQVDLSLHFSLVFPSSFIFCLWLLFCSPTSWVLNSQFISQLLSAPDLFLLGAIWPLSWQTGLQLSSMTCDSTCLSGAIKSHWL